jgi:hypothetical protein
MAKFETVCCVMTWGLMNALFVAVAVGSSFPIEGRAYTQTAQATHAAPVARG